MTEALQEIRRPEISENGMAVRRLELLGAHEQLRQPASRREFFAGMSNDDYKHMLGYINSLTRGENIYYDYEDGKLLSGDTPPLEDKEPLMNLAYASVRHILADKQWDDATALRRAALTMGGAINFVHPKENGCGRTARLMHYGIEFGTERGDQAFSEEVYAIIAKQPIYDTDNATALYNTPPGPMRRALDQQAQSRDPKGYANMNLRQRGSARVRAFLEMMRGDITVPINQTVNIARDIRSLDTIEVERVPAGHIDAYSLYERTYLGLSEIPNRSPADIPYGAHRILAE